MELLKALRSVDLFEGLSDDELQKVAGICTEMHFTAGDTIANQGETGDKLFIITDGFVDIILSERPSASTRVIVSLGSGQIIGEMALLDQGPRSASLRATSKNTALQAITRDDFERLCRENTHIGYAVMRNLATDLSFKLRHRNLSDRKAI